MLSQIAKNSASKAGAHVYSSETHNNFIGRREYRWSGQVSVQTIGFALHSTASLSGCILLGLVGLLTLLLQVRRILCGRRRRIGSVGSLGWLHLCGGRRLR